MQYKNLLIIYPHWHPANLAGVHRPRLTGNFLKDFGWKPIVLTVDDKYYEETPDRDFEKTFSKDFEVYRVNAYKITKPRIIGDIGLRAFFQLKRKALELIPKLKIDFIWIPIPSFYTSLLGLALYKKTGIPYGIDYIDPWVRDISKNPDLRARLSIWVAKKLEPKAVKNASLITGVSYEYFKPMLSRNFRLCEEQSNEATSVFARGEATKQTVQTQTNANQPTKGRPLTASFPYGFDPHDHEIVLENLQMPWQHVPHCKPIVYAGAFLPNCGYFTQILFKTIKTIKDKGLLPPHIHFYFIGTGHYKHKSVLEYAKENQVEDIVTEIRDRYPFLQILNIISAAYRILVLGTTEKHYTASKIFQSILSKRPVMAIFHHESSVNNILNETKADQYLVKYTPGMNETELEKQVEKTFIEYLKEDTPWHPDYMALDKYSAREGAKILAEKMEEIVSAKTKAPK